MSITRVGILLCMASCGIVFNIAYAVEYLKYDNNLGFSIEYPSDWSKLDFEDGVSFLPSGLNEQNFEQVEISVTVKDPSERSSELSNSSLTSYSNFKLDNDILPFHENVTKITNRTLGNLPAFGVYYVERNVGAPNIIDTNLNLWTIKNGLVYEITFFSQQVDYKKYEPIINEMINSFSFGI